MSEQSADHTSPGARGRGAFTQEPTGVPNLDLVLGGGLPRGALAIVMGPPGSGKTTLANQIAFAAATRGRRALVLTALSEATSKLLEHLRGFRFFDQDLVGDAIQFLSLEHFLAQGLDATSAALIETARAERADYVVLDGFRGVPGVDLDAQRARQFLYDVGNALSLRGATTIVTSEANPRDPAFYPEVTTADMIVGLYFTLEGVRHLRGLEAVKIRGGEPLPGLHSLSLNAEGISVYPRLEARVLAAGPGHPLEREQWDELGGLSRATFGLPELDALLAGGLVRHTSTLLAGSLGTGKTLLALHFALAGVQAGEPVVFLGFRETGAQLQYRVDSLGLGDRWRAALADGGGLSLIHYDPVEVDPDLVADQLLVALDRSRAQRLVVDSLAELEAAVREHGAGTRLRNFLAALLVALRTRGVTLLAIKETPEAVAMDFGFTADALSVLAENVLLLQQLPEGTRLRRMLGVVKTRFSAHNTGLREFVITAEQGVQVLPATAIAADLPT